MPSSGIFISYRREDAAGHAGWLHEGLAGQFGEDRVFMDLGIPPGEDYFEHIEAAISGCAALLVVIGPKWLTAMDANGRRRLDDEGDLVRVEVATALARTGLRVVPILVHDARMPVANELPKNLVPLARRQAIELRDESWRFDVDRLIRALDGVLAAYDASIAGQQPGKPEESATDEAPRQPDEPAPESALPADTSVEGTIPGETRLKEPLPEETPLEDPLPEETPLEEPLPEEPNPEEPNPEETRLKEPLPEETPLEELVPEETPLEEPVPEETPPEQTVSEQTLPEHTRRRRAIAVGSVAVVALTVLVVLLIGGGNDADEGGGGGGAADGGGAESVVELTAGSGPDDIAIDAENVWVTQDERGTLARISRADGELLTEDLDVGADADGVATGAGTVWAVSTGENRVTQFRPGDTAPLTRIDVEPGPRGIAVGPEDVWVVNSQVDQLTRIGLAEAKVTDVIPVGNDPREVILGARGLVWVANVKDRSVTRVDVETDPPGREHIPVGGRPRDIARDSRGYIWVALADADKVVRIGPSNAAGKRNNKWIAVGARPSGLAISGGLVWVTNADDNTVSLIDEQSLEPVGVPIPVGERPVAIAAEGDTAWVANYSDDTVTRITAASARG